MAILTALLVNEYIRIKSERGQIDRRLDQIEGKLAQLERQRKTHLQEVSAIRDKWEAKNREKAEERVDEFIVQYVGEGEICQPFEVTTVHDLLDHMADFHEFDSVDEMEASEIPHHQEALEERMGEIGYLITDCVTEQFAKRHEGEGREERSKLSETFQEMVAEKSHADTGMPEPSVSELDEFVDMFREEYEIDSLRKSTRQSLQDYYDEIVTKQPETGDLFLPPDVGAGFNSPIHGIDPEMIQSISPHPSPEVAKMKQRQNIEEKRRYNSSKDKLNQVEAQISGLEHEKTKMKNKKDSLDPNELQGAIWANVFTILLSVVIPISIYLLTITTFPENVPEFFPPNTEFGIAFLSWFVGLSAVFDWLYAHVNNKQAISEGLVQSLRNCGVSTLF